MTEITNKRWLSEVRTWLDTPFHHQGRVKGVGVDCIGVVVGSARDLGLPHQDMRGYKRRPDHQMLETQMEKQLDIVSGGLDDLRLGDIFLFTIRKDPQHVAIYCGIGNKGLPYMIHAYLPAKKVIMEEFSQFWKNSLVDVFRMKDLV